VILLKHNKLHCRSSVNLILVTVASHIWNIKREWFGCADAPLRS